MVRQRSVGETKPSDIIPAADCVENTAAVQGPESEMANQNRYHRAVRDGRVSRERFHPADIELRPRHQGSSSSFEVGIALPN